MNTTVPAGLRLMSDTLDDLESLRKATGNRYNFATRDTADKDGKWRGLGLDDRHPTVALTGAVFDGLARQEHQLTLGLQRELRKTIFAGWVKAQKGVGEKTIGRLLASTGDPYINEQTGEPRTLRQFWAYSGLAVDDGVARRPRKGMSQDDLFKLGKATSKMRAYLVAERLVVAGIRTIDPEYDESKIDGYPIENRTAVSRYGEVYLARRAATASRAHTAPCVRCGPAGKPAQPGSPWSGAHQQADALRILSKEILRDLWEIARSHYETPESTSGTTARKHAVPGPVAA